MEKACIELKKSFPFLCCQPCTSCRGLQEPQNKTKTGKVSFYKVLFTKGGIVINAFDKFKSVSFEKKKCVDNIVINHTDTKYIELKNKIRYSKIKDIGSKFYFAHQKSLPILKNCPSLNTHERKFIIIYTTEDFNNNDNAKIDPNVKRKKQEIKHYIDAWNKHKVIIPESIDFIAPNKELSIIKIKYDESSAPIFLDSY